MVAKRKKATKASIAAGIAAVVCTSLVAVCAVGFGVAAAGAGSNASTFGLAAVSADDSAAQADFLNVSEAAHESIVLANTTQRDVTHGYDAIVAIEEEERRIAEEEARRQQEENQRKADEANAQSLAQSLAPVDFSVGKEAFLTEWTARIDAYLAGSPLAGYGATFAAAAWEYGVDPRFSPAISNTESTKGTHCFRPYNAWGWMGDTAWSSWDESIYAHVRGLAEGYGHTISVWAAQKYCPPTYMDWYQKTITQMQMI